MKRKITVIDDDADLRRLLQIGLKLDGFEVDVFSNGDDFMNSRNQNPASEFYVIDVNLGGISGPEICKRLKKEQLTQRASVVLISANPELQQLAKESAADGYIFKPFSQKDLITKLRTLPKK
jgi:DNA-binding response OmpR family regulator